MMARGIEKRKIFLSDTDRKDFLARIAKVAPVTGTVIYAWSLIPNHFHLLLRSGRAGLSKFMRQLQTGYAVSFNRRHKRTGHLFQNRFKSILVEEEPYFLELVRYLHLNPFRAKIVKNLRELDTYSWTGHAVLLGKEDVSWQDVSYVLQHFGSDITRARRAYRQFVAEGLRQGRRPELTGGGLIRSAGEGRTLPNSKEAAKGGCRMSGCLVAESSWKRSWEIRKKAIGSPGRFCLKTESGF